jgi:hypothetical protein
MEHDIERQLLNSWMPALVDNYEGPERNRWITLNCSVEEFEQVREYLASLIAQGLLRRNFGDGYRLTDQGYLKFSPRVKAQRVMSS